MTYLPVINVEIDKILVPNKWYLYSDTSHGTMLIQFQYKVGANHDTGVGQDTYVFEVFGRSHWVRTCYFPLFVVLAKIEQDQFKQVEVNTVFMDLFK